MDNQSKIEKDKVIKEKTVKKSKNIAVIFAILGTGLIVLGILLAQLVSNLVTGASFVMMFTTMVPLVAVLVLLIIPMAFLMIAGVNLFLTLTYISSFVFSILSLVLNRKKKEYLPTTLACITTPLAFTYSLSGIRATISAISFALIFLGFIFVGIPIIVVAILAGNGAI